MIILCDL